ncbi:MAG: phage major capsid protein [Faecousia sp.]
MNNLNTLITKRTDLLQKRADALEAATKKYNSGDMTGYDADMETVKGYNAQLETLNGLISETEKSFGGEEFPGAGASGQRSTKAALSLVDTIRGTEKYANAWLESVRKGISPDKGIGIQSLQPLYEAERAMKALSIAGGDTPGEDGGFLVPIDFDTKVNELMKEYVDLSALVTVERVSVNDGWRVYDTTGTRTALTKVDELGKINPGKQPSFKRIAYHCSKHADKLIISNELMADAGALITYLAGWWAPKFVMTKNEMILTLLKALPFSALAGATDAEQIKALKTLMNTGLNTAHAKRATILTNASGYNVMDNWAETNGRPILVPDPKGNDFSRFKGRPVQYADADLIPDVTVGDTGYNPFYVGDFKAFCTLFLRQGTRIRSTDIGGDAWDTDTTEIRCTCRMDCKGVDNDAVKFTGLKAGE